MAFGILYDFLMGQTIEAYKYFGAHFEKRIIEREIDVPLKKDSSKTKKTLGKVEVNGVVFRLYAPMASDVSVIGEFNDWNPAAHKMKKVDDCGVYEIFIENLNNKIKLSELENYLKHN